MTVIYKFSNGTLADADEVNNNIDFLLTNNIINDLNATGSFSLYQTVIDKLTANTGSITTNWTYDAGSDAYYNNQTGSAILEFGTLLSKEQKTVIGSYSNVLLWVDSTFAGNVGSSPEISNFSFETAGAGGSVFSGWSQGSGTGFNSTWTQDTGSVTDGTYAARWTVPIQSDPTLTGSVIQTIDVTNINKIYVTASGSSTGTGAHSQYGLLQCGGSSSQYTLGLTPTKMVLDVSGLTGSQTLSIVGSHVDGGGAGTHGCSYWFDDVRFLFSNSHSNTFRSYEISTNGSSGWTAISLGSLTPVGTITDLGVRIVEVNPVGTGSITNNSVNGFGVKYG